MSTHSAVIDLSIAAREMISDGIKKGVIDSRFRVLLNLPTGTSDGQINKSYYVKETGIGATVTTVYDLIGSLLDEDGAAINFDEVVLIAIRNLSTTAANYLTVGPDATNGFGVVATNKGFWADATDRNVVAADGDSWLVMYCEGGVAAAAGTTDELAVITQGGTANNTWEILILGRDN